MAVCMQGRGGGRLPPVAKTKDKSPSLWLWEQCLPVPGKDYIPPLTTLGTRHLVVSSSAPTGLCTVRLDQRPSMVSR